MSKKKRGEESMKEEDNILKKVGTKNSFQVPEGYFENLTSEVMNKLPEKEKSAFEKVQPTTWMRIRPLLYMAAMFIGAALIIRIASSNHTPEPEGGLAVTEVETETIPDEYIDAALDRSMMDDYSLYVYLSDAGVE